MALPEYRDIVDLFAQGATAEAEAKFLALRERLQETLQQRHRDVTDHTAPDGQIEWDGTAYYRVDNGRKIGRFCQRCYDTAGRLEKLHAQDSATYRCPACRTKYERKLCG